MPVEDGLTIWEELRRINDTGTTIFLKTQYLEEADQLCDRLAIIDGGLIVAEGTLPVNGGDLPINASSRLAQP